MSGGNPFNFSNFGKGGGGGGSGAFGSGAGGGTSGTNSSGSPSKPPIFGTSNQPTSSASMFGAAPAASATSGASLFSGGSKLPGTPLFGFKSDAPASPGTSAGTSSAPSFLTPNKPASIFGQGQQGTAASNNIFGSTASNPPASAGSTTPAPSKPPSFANMSTTPAGPPPSSSAGAGQQFFSFNKPQNQSATPFGITGSHSAASQAPATSASATTSLFGGGGTTAPAFNNLFNKPSTSSTPASSTPASTAAAPSSGGISFGPPAGASQASGGQQQGSNLFGNLGASLGGQGASSTPSTQAKTPSFSFPPAASQPPSSSASSTTQNKPLFNFPGTAASAAASSAAPASGATAPSPFSFPSNASSAATPGTAKPANINVAHLSGNINNPAGSGGQPEQSQPPQSSGSSAPGSTAPVTTAPTTTASSTTASGSNAPSTTAAAPAQPNAFGQSTAGPKPEPMSRLKNKSMDEIITRWATDLSKYQKEFQSQATKVAKWDRILVENSDKIQVLYGSTLEAERATVEVERQLTSVENDQQELEYWLDTYEKQVDEMTSSQVGSGDSLTGPDQERERTYKLAEKLSDRLDEMAKDLKGMVEGINDASSHLIKNVKPDDPLSQIVRVLNGHLSQLQQIDQGTASLQAKVAAAQKAGRTLGNGAGNPLGTDSADDFYRSYLRGR